MPSMERLICPIAEFIMTDIVIFQCASAKLPIISTSGLTSEVTIVFMDPDFLYDA